MGTRKELIEAVGARYRHASAADKSTILDEFVAVTGYHRKHAIRVLAEDETAFVAPRRARSRLYDEAAHQALVLLWQAGDRVCGKRLKLLLPLLMDAMERHGHLDVDPEVKPKLLCISAATIDRALARSRRPALMPTGSAGGGPVSAQRSGAACPCAPSPSKR